MNHIIMTVNDVLQIFNYPIKYETTNYCTLTNNINYSQNQFIFKFNLE